MFWYNVNIWYRYVDTYFSLVNTSIYTGMLNNIDFNIGLGV